MLVTNSFGVVEPAIGLQIMMETILHLFVCDFLFLLIRWSRFHFHYVSALTDSRKR